MFRLSAPVIIRVKELKLVPDNLLFIYAEAYWEATEMVSNMTSPEKPS